MPPSASRWLIAGRRVGSVDADGVLTLDADVALAVHWSGDTVELVSFPNGQLPAGFSITPVVTFKNGDDGALQPDQRVVKLDFIYHAPEPSR